MPTRRDPRAECRPNAEPTLHESIIRALVAADPRMCRNGFWRALLGVAADEGLEDEDLAEPVFQPDAYLVDAALKHINIFEVEVSPPADGAEEGRLRMVLVHLGLPARRLGAALVRGRSLRPRQRARPAGNVSRHSGPRGRSMTAQTLSGGVSNG